MVVRQFVGAGRVPPGRCKKRLAGSVGEIARTGRTGDPVLAAYFLAQHVNIAAGGTVIAPWEVQQLPLEWLDGAQAITTRLPEACKANTLIEQKLASWRANHPAYSRHQ